MIHSQVICYLKKNPSISDIENIFFMFLNNFGYLANVTKKINWLLFLSQIELFQLFSKFWRNKLLFLSFFRYLTNLEKFRSLE